MALVIPPSMMKMDDHQFMADIELPHRSMLASHCSLRGEASHGPPCYASPDSKRSIKDQNVLMASVDDLNRNLMSAPQI